MSLLKLIKQQLGVSVTPANNFTLDASADNGTMKLARGNAGATTQDIMTVDAAGKVAFPQNLLPIVGTASGGISSELGTINSGSWSGKWSRIGSIIKFDFTITIGNAGTGDGALYLHGFPKDGLTLQTAAYGVGRTSGGLICQVYTSGSNLALFKADNTTLIANGTVLGSITYQVA